MCFVEIVIHDSHTVQRHAQLISGEDIHDSWFQRAQEAQRGIEGTQI
jgi:hypothetical protein